MPRRPASLTTLSPGCAIMMMGCISLMESDSPGDLSDDLGMFLLAIGLDILKAQRQSGTRYGPRGKYKTNKVKVIIDGLLSPETSDREFKAWLRINRSSFFRLLDLIKDDPVFQSTGQKPQMPVKYQLATFLTRHGWDPAMKIKTVLGVSEGSVYNLTYRVVKALRRLKPLYLAWPSRKERKKLKRRAGVQGFPGAIGAIDGTLIDLKLKPQKNAVAFRTRKKTWGLNMQAVVDWDGKFISYDLGWPGCTPDVTVWKESHLWLHRDSYLSRSEWLVGDRGYPLTVYLITMFREGQWAAPGTSRRIAQCKSWNTALSSLRIVVEHAFGRLKGRFPFLQLIRANKIDQACKVVEALMVIHNFMIDLNDWPDDIENVDMVGVLRRESARRPKEANFAPSQEAARNNDHARALGMYRRSQLLDYWLAHERGQ